jgi:uncharacterized protein YuzE
VKITYDERADALYIVLREVELRSRVEIEEGVAVNLDRDGHIVGLEILNASERLTPEELINMSYENSLLASTPQR